MRHRKKVKKLGRTASHRRATLRNLASALINHHQIKTTLAKGKASRSNIEKLITTAKKDSMHARRRVFKFLQNRTLVKKLFDEIAPSFANRNGGYTRIVKLGPRTGDSAEMAILQLVGFEQVIIDEQEKQKKQRKERVEKKKAKEAEEAAEAAEVVETVETEKEKETKEAKKETKEKKTEQKEEVKESKEAKKAAKKEDKKKEVSKKKTKTKEEKPTKTEAKVKEDKKEDSKEKDKK